MSMIYIAAAIFGVVFTFKGHAAGSAVFWIGIVGLSLHWKLGELSERINNISKRVPYTKEQLGAKEAS